MKPFSAYPEDRIHLLQMSRTILADTEMPKVALALAELVRAILEDEQWGLENEVWKPGDFTSESSAETESATRENGSPRSERRRK